METTELKPWQTKNAQIFHGKIITYCACCLRERQLCLKHFFKYLDCLLIYASDPLSESDFEPPGKSLYKMDVQQNCIFGLVRLAGALPRRLTHLELAGPSPELIMISF